MASVDFKQEFARLIEALQIAQKRGCYNLDEASAIHKSIVQIQQANLTNNTTPTPAPAPISVVNPVNVELQSERDQLVSLLGEYKNAIDEFKKQHDEQLFNLRVEKETQKELQLRVNSLEQENQDLRQDLSELVNSNTDDDEPIPVVVEEKSKAKRKVKAK